MMAQPALKLHEAIDAYEIALEWIDEHETEIEAAGGELPPALIELLEEAEGTLADKMGRVGLVTINLKRVAEAQRNEAQRILAHAKTTERKRDALHGYLLQTLHRMGEVRVDTPLCKVRRQTNPIRVQVPPGQPVPEQYQIIHPAPEPTFDSARAAHDIKAFHADELAQLVPGGAPVLINGLLVSCGEHVRVW